MTIIRGSATLAAADRLDSGRGFPIEQCHNGFRAVPNTRGHAGNRWAGEEHS